MTDTTNCPLCVTSHTEDSLGNHCQCGLPQHWWDVVESVIQTATEDAATDIKDWQQAYRNAKYVCGWCGHPLDENKAPIEVELTDRDELPHAHGEGCCNEALRYAQLDPRDLEPPAET